MDLYIIILFRKHPSKYILCTTQGWYYTFTQQGHTMKTQPILVKVCVLFLMIVLSSCINDDASNSNNTSVSSDQEMEGSSELSSSAIDTESSESSDETIQSSDTEISSSSNDDATLSSSEATVVSSSSTEQSSSSNENSSLDSISSSSVHSSSSVEQEQLTGHYYVDNVDGDDDNVGTSIDAPWKTLDKVDAMTFEPGEKILFKRGSSYSGSVIVDYSGTEVNPITITAYGTGDAPAFTNPDFYDSYGNVFHITGDYIVIDSLYFHGGADANQGEYSDAMRVGAVFVAVGADHVTIKDSEFYDCTIGINSVGQYTLITNNNLHDFNRWIQDLEWGPLGIVIGNAYAEVSYNYLTKIYKEGGNYGADGGAIEVEDRFFGVVARDANIHHNTSIRNYGFVEVEGNVDGDNINISYNVSNDYQNFIFFWGGKDSKVENNTIIRTLPPLGNPASVNTVFTMNNGGFEFRNNIFVVGNGLDVWGAAPYGSNAGFASAIKENNIYFSADGSTGDPHGLGLGSNEEIIDPGFVDLDGGDYHLTSGSPAINAGTDLGYTLDIEDNAVPNDGAPDIGAFEY